MKRYPWEKRRHYWADRIGLAKDAVVGRILCALGRHWWKFGTHPYCARCGQVVTK